CDRAGQREARRRSRGTRRNGETGRAVCQQRPTAHGRMTDQVYRDQVLEVEPTGIEYIPSEQRHGNPRQLFGLWFSANAEIATWMVGVFAVALYGTSLRGAAIGLIVGNLVGFALLGIL